MAVANKFVDEAVVEKRVVAKKLVEVEFVVVDWSAVKFWRVEEPLTWRLDRVVRPAVAVSVPVKLAEEEMF